MRGKVFARIGLAAGLAFAAAGATAAPGKIDIVAFGLWGDQSVFASEAEGAARAIARQFGPVDKVVVRANTKRSGEATEDNLRATLFELGAKMDPERDLLFLVLTSHGDQEGVGVQTPPDQTSSITPIELRTMLRESGARLSVVIVSACYSGVFADAMAEPDTLVITAADGDHASFGCRDGAKWTSFGEALAKTKSLPAAFALARSLVAEREQAEGFDPSNPQMAGGRRVLELLGGQP